MSCPSHYRPRPFVGITGTTLTVSPAELTNISVTPPADQAPVGATRQYTATGKYTDGTFQNLTSSVTWASNNAAVAPVTNTGVGKGLATAVSPGSATIRATVGAIMGSAVLTVQP